MGEHTIPREQLEYPRTILLLLREISQVHPAVLKMHSEFQPEPFVRLHALKADVIRDSLEAPSILVVPIPGKSDYWVWGGIRTYWRLANYGWEGKVKVLDYGPRIPETRIVRLAKANWLCTPIISGPNRKSDWAFAQNWEANTDYICKPTKSGTRRPSGRNVFAKLSGLDPRPLRADKHSKTLLSDLRPGPATDIGKGGGASDDRKQDLYQRRSKPLPNHSAQQS